MPPAQNQGKLEPAEFLFIIFMGICVLSFILVTSYGHIEKILVQVGWVQKRTPASPPPEALPNEQPLIVNFLVVADGEEGNLPKRAEQPKAGAATGEEPRLASADLVLLGTEGGVAPAAAPPPSDPTPSAEMRLGETSPTPMGGDGAAAPTPRPGGRPDGLGPAPREDAASSEKIAAEGTTGAAGGRERVPGTVHQIGASRGSMAHVPRDGSVLVPARLGLPLQVRGEDLWVGWPDAHQRAILGEAGVERLTAAFELVEQSRARSVTADLMRKGIPISFGDPQEFSGDQAQAVVVLEVAPRSRPPKPQTIPAVTFNPAFLHAQPEVLACALVRAGTQFQQYLDGSLWDPSQDPIEPAFTAWWNAAAFWDEVRGQVWPFETALEQEEEFSYQASIRGESELKDLLSALGVAPSHAP